MASYSIGEIEKLTGIKAHVLRYWEEVIPSIAPKKDLGGRRAYSQKNLQQIMRLKYLIQERRFTIEGARSEMIREAQLYFDDDGSLVSQKISVALEAITEMRELLTDVYVQLQTNRQKQWGSRGD